MSSSVSYMLFTHLCRLEYIHAAWSSALDAPRDVKAEIHDCLEENQASQSHRRWSIPYSHRWPEWCTTRQVRVKLVTHVSRTNRIKSLPAVVCQTILLWSCGWTEIASIASTQAARKAFRLIEFGDEVALPVIRPTNECVSELPEGMADSSEVEPYCSFCNWHNHRCLNTRLTTNIAKKSCELDKWWPLCSASLWDENLVMPYEFVDVPKWLAVHPTWIFVLLSLERRFQKTLCLP